jgi:hypothetical protein
MSYIGDIFKQIATPLVGLGVGLILNNQAVQKAKGEANDAKAYLELQAKIAEENRKALELLKAGGKPPEEEKSNLPLYIGLGVGGVAILIFVIFKLTKKNNNV